MKALAPSELFKYDYRVELFLNKYRSGEPFELLDGSLVTFEYDVDTDKLIQDRMTKKLSFRSADGSIYRFSNIAKNAEFGGGSNNLDRENQQIEKLSEQIKSLGAVSLEFKNTAYKVVDCVSTDGTPKSDFHFISENGDPCVWVSHKHGTDAYHFQQWGGVSARREPEIHYHPEVQSFITDLSTEYPDGLTNKTTVYRKIQDPQLKMMSVYGNEYSSGIYGEQNVSYVAQGDVTIKDSKLVAHRVHENGDELKNSFDPILAAVYKGDRSDCGIKNTRLGIIPHGSRPLTKEI